MIFVAIHREKAAVDCDLMWKIFFNVQYLLQQIDVLKIITDEIQLDIKLPQQSLKCHMLTLSIINYKKFNLF